jgi:hypothetical protein
MRTTMPPYWFWKPCTIVPPATAWIGEPSGAMMSMPSCRRPPERAAPQVSTSFAPVTGRTSEFDATPGNAVALPAGAVAVAPG